MPLLFQDHHAFAAGVSQHLRVIGITSYTILDWLCILVLHHVNNWMDYSPPWYFQDPAWYLDDPAYAFPHVEHATVPVRLLYALTYWLPLGVVVLLGAARLSALEIHSGLLSYLAGFSVMWFATDFIKQFVGELRPDFFDRCKWDKILQQCTGPAGLVSDGRKSFPSGHSSYGLYAGVFLFLFLSGKSGGLAFGQSATINIEVERLRSVKTSKLFRFIVACTPLFMGLWIAISRWEDHVHHPVDILAGSLLGTTFAIVFYLMHWPSPFNSDNIDTMARPRIAAHINESRIALPIEREQLEEV